MDLSVVICTRNRAQSLRNTLTSLTRLAIPAGTDWEVVVVDNGSTDDTGGTIAAFASALPIHSILQPLAGVSNARNTGIDTARGDYILWTDDDILVAPNWLAAYLAAFRRHPGAAVFGGGIVPRLLPPTPAWFARAVDDLADMLATRDFGPVPVPLDPAAGRLPFGGNYAIRAAEQRRYRYDPRLGVAPGRRQGGEETMVMQAILDDAGATGWWVPDSAVEHLVPPQNQTINYIVAYYESVGMSDGRPLSAVEFGVKLPLAFLRLWFSCRWRQSMLIRSLTRCSYWNGRFKCQMESALVDWQRSSETEKPEPGSGGRSRSPDRNRKCLKHS